MFRAYGREVELAHKRWVPAITVPGEQIFAGASLSVSLSTVLLDGWTAWRCWLCWQIYGPTAAGPSGEQAPSWATSSISSLKFRTQADCNNVLTSKELNALSPSVQMVCVWCAIFVSVLGLNALLNSWRMKDQLDVTCYFISLMCSTCFGH